MTNRASKTTLPVDSRGQVIEGAMGLPIVADDVALMDASDFVDIFDLSGAAYDSRVFTGIAIRNLSAASTVEISFGEDFSNTRNMVVGVTEFFVLDDLMFGPAVIDESTGDVTTKVRARLGTATGTKNTATIVYAGNPANGQKISINSKVYEFSDDLSKDPSSDYIVAIGLTEDASWTNLVAVVNASEQSLRASIVVGTNTVTLSSVAGGSRYAAIPCADVSTGAIFSGATLTGAVGGISPVFHIW